MSTSTDSCHDLDMVEADRRDNVYSSASSYSTYSREVKFIFNPADDRIDEYGDYSHINQVSKQNYVSHTPHTYSTSSQVSGKENRTPHHSRNDPTFATQHQVTSLRMGSAHSSASRDRGPITPHVEEGLYSPTHYGYAPRKQSATSENNYAKEKIYFSPGSDISQYPYARHSIQVWKNNNVPVPPSHHQNFQKQPNTLRDMHSRNNRNDGPVLNTFHTQHPLTSVHGSYHYQQPNNHLNNHQNNHPVNNESSYKQQSQNHHNQTGHEPPYPMPPRYNHQHHARRKTWSPPTLKMSLLNASSQVSRVCYSNDSIDIADEAGLERKTQSLSEDLDVTPPKLAPISGVLAQKPGPNLIRPIAFKPVQTGSSRSPISNVARRLPEAGDNSSGSHDTARPQVLNSLGLQGSPYSQNGRSTAGAFNSTIKPYNHNSGGVTHALSSSEHAQDSGSQPHSLFAHNHSTSANSSQNSSHHSSSINPPNHNVSNNTYCNVPATFSHSASSSHFSTSNEAGLSSEHSRTSERSESAQPVSVLRVSFHAAEGALQTPSPSDSGVGELEAMLREKDAEINTLREVMDRNERAIFQVYEERKNNWLHDNQEIQNDYERKLKVQSRKAYKTEQLLSMQVYKLQQEQKTMQEEKVEIITERDTLKQRDEENNNHISQLKLALETALADGRNNIDKSQNCEKLIEGFTDEEGKHSKESVSLQEELALKNKELITLKSKLHSLQADMEKKNKELAEKVRDISTKTEEVKLLRDELGRLRDPPILVENSAQTHVPSEVATLENIKPSILGERDRTISGLQEEIAEIHAQVVLLKVEHEKEREQWLDEKNRVVRYQKQLQLNYIQMQRKNVTLETEVQQLTLELENRDMKLIALTGEESVC